MPNVVWGWEIAAACGCTTLLGKRLDNNEVAMSAWACYKGPEAALGVRSHAEAHGLWMKRYMDEVLLDPETGEPSFVTIDSQLFRIETHMRAVLDEAEAT